MTESEHQIVSLLESNPYISNELKKRYLFALFLMNDDEQKEYLEIIKAFDYRCKAVERGMYILSEDEKQGVLRSLEDVKEDILRKIHSNH